MKKITNLKTTTSNIIRTLLCAVILLGAVSSGKSQTDIINNPSALTTLASANNQAITFRVKNNNANPIQVQKVLYPLFSTLNTTYNVTYKLWHTTTDISSTTPNIATTNGWTNDATVTLAPVTSSAYYYIFSGLTLSIPAGQTWRFAVSIHTVTVNPTMAYGGVGSTPTSTTSVDNVVVEAGINGGGYRVGLPNVGPVLRNYAGGVSYVVLPPPVTNDASVDLLYSFGKLATVHSANHAVRARITNNGTNTLTSLPVTLSLTGANSFSDVQTIASLAPSASTTVTFAGYTPTVVGTNTVTVSVPSDNVNTNNSKSITQLSTTNQIVYKDASQSNSGGVGFTGGTGAFVGKFFSATGGQINEVKVDFSAAGATYRLGIYGDNGGVPSLTPLYTDATDRTATLGTAILTLGNPVTVPAGNFYVGVRQTGTTNASFAYTTETPLRANNFFYTSPLPETNAWTELSGASLNFRFNIEVQFYNPCSGTPVLATAVSSASSVCTGGTNLSLTGITEAFSGMNYQWQQSINSGAYTDIVGANSDTYIYPSFTTGGSYTFRCVLTCTNSSQSTPSNPTSPVTVYQLASITPSSIVLCPSSTVVATALPAGADSYLWTGGLGSAQTASVTAAGTYSVTVTQGSCVTTASVTAIAASDPVLNSVTASPNPACSGGNTTLTASASPVATPSYCTPSTTSGGTVGDEITLFSSSGLGFNYSNAVQTATPGYLDKTVSVTAGNAIAGNTYSITVNQQDAGDAFRIWIDMNNNGSFEDAGELLATSATGAAITLNITIPGTTLNGSHRLRIRNTFDATNTIASTLSCTNGNTYGVTIDFTLNVSGGIDPITYAWSPSTFLGSTTSSSVNATNVTSPVTYTVVVTSYQGCAVSGTVGVTVVTQSVAPTSLACSAVSNTICNGNSANISQAGGSLGTNAFWQWYDDNNIAVGTAVSSADASISVSPSVTTTYHLRSEGGASPCSGTVENSGLTVTVTVNPTPSVTATPSSTSTCSGTAPSISLSGGASYSWIGTPDAGTSIGSGNMGDPSSGSSSTISEVLTNSSNSAAGQVVYSVSTVSSEGCPSSSNTLITVDVNPLPIGTLTDANNQVIAGENFCNGGSTDLHLGSSISGTTFAWSSTISGNAYSSGTSNPINESIPNNGTTDVTAIYTITPSANGCDGAPFTATEVVEAKPVSSNTTAFACTGYNSSISLTSSLGANTGYTWTSSVTSGAVSYNNTSGSTSTIDDTYTNTSGTTAVVTYTVSPYSLLGTLGCAGDDYTVEVSVGSIPMSPGIISGPAVVCQMSTATYSIAAVAEATSYVWTVPGGVVNGIFQGMTILSQNNSGPNPSITVSITSGTVIGDITVTAINGCVDGLHPANAPATLHITKKPAVPGAISGPTSVCGVTSTTYSVAPVFGATSYAWTLPSGMTIIGSSAGASINVSIASTYAYGQVKVSAVNACGNIPGTALTVYGTPAAPVSLTGPTNVCGASTATYVSSASSGATSYSWTLPSGMAPIGSATGTTINVSITGNVSGTISVKANSPCGSSTNRSLTLTTTATAPGAITGPTNICSLTTANYSVAAVAGAVSYVWTLSPGITGTSSSSTITVSIASTVSNGTIKVATVNACGSTSAQTPLTVSKTVTPGTISGNTGVCTGTVETYTIPRVSGITYTWSAVGGTVSAQTLTPTTSSVNVTWNSTAGAGTVKVNGTNTCGQSPDRTLAVIKTACASPIAVDNNSETTKAQFNLYPNPTSDDFTMDVTSAMDQDLVIEVYDVLGNKVISEQHSVTTGVTSLKTNIESFRNGMYFVRVVDMGSNTLYTQTVTKQ